MKISILIPFMSLCVRMAFYREMLLFFHQSLPISAGEGVQGLQGPRLNVGFMVQTEALMGLRPY